MSCVRTSSRSAVPPGSGPTTGVRSSPVGASVEELHRVAQDLGDAEVRRDRADEALEAVAEHHDPLALLLAALEETHRDGLEPGSRCSSA